MVQSSVKAKSVAGAISMKELVFCSNTMIELGFGVNFFNVPIYVDNTSALNVEAKRSKAAARNTSPCTTSLFVNSSRRAGSLFIA